MFDRAFQFLHVPADEGVAHPGNTENRDDCLHAGGEDGALYGLYAVRPGDEQDKGGSREHQDLDDMRHLHLPGTAIGQAEPGTKLCHRAEQDDTDCRRYEYDD